MTIQAGGMLETVKSANPGWDVAFGTSHRAVLSQEGEGCLLMQLHSENRRFETVFSVATGALPVIAPLCELTPVRIRRVAVHTPVVQNWSAEITAVVALNTRHGCMQTSQRKGGSVVIKGRGHLDRAPTAGLMTTLAILSEGPLVGIQMTVVAPGKRNSPIPGLDIRHFLRQVTLLAGYFGVKAGKREHSSLMIKTTGGFPGREGMATGTFDS
jgi:hypothetical protein